MPPSAVTWKADPHTRAKIQIVQGYLAAWFPIISSFNGRVLYIDGFCGPGEYAGGEKGSPIVALETALNHRHDLSGTELAFLFIDSRENRIEHLQQLLERYSLPENIKYKCICSTFDETLTELLDSLENRNKRIAPTFLFVDPFGISDTPFSIIQRFIANPRCEVLVNLMYSYVNRFKTELPDHLDQLFGTPKWHAIEEIADSPAEREQFVVSLYQDQLHKVAAYVWAFRMIDMKNTTCYYLFFATNHILGLKKMKESMWRIAPTGDYSFSDRRANQLTVFGPEGDVTQLRFDLVNKYKGETVTIEEVEEFVIIGTDFLPSHLRRRTLVNLEREGLIEVLTPRVRRYTYPPGCKIRFRG